MKKVISLFLALLMIFSVASFAFAMEGPAPDDDTPAFDLGSLEDMPVWEAKMIAKVAKIAVKLVVAFVKVGVKLGFIAEDDITAKVEEFAGGLLENLPVDIDVATIIDIALT